MNGSFEDKTRKREKAGIEVQVILLCVLFIFIFPVI